MRQARGGLKKVLEAIRAPSVLLIKLRALQEASGTFRRPDIGKPTPFSRKANPAKKIVETTCSLSVCKPGGAQEGCAQQHGATAEKAQSRPFCQAFCFFGSCCCHYCFLGEEMGLLKNLPELLKGLIFTCSITWAWQRLPSLCAVMFYCSLSFHHDES